MSRYSVVDDKPRVYIVGDEGYGKGALLNQVLDNIYTPHQSRVYGAYQCTKIINGVSVDLCDLGSYERLKDCFEREVQESAAVIVIYDDFADNSLPGVVEWLKYIVGQDGHNQSQKVFIVANKQEQDLPSDKQLSVDEINLAAAKIGLDEENIIISPAVCVETGENVANLFESVAEKISLMARQRHSHNLATLMPKKSPASEPQAKHVDSCKII